MGGQVCATAYPSNLLKQDYCRLQTGLEDCNQTCEYLLPTVCSLAQHPDAINGFLMQLAEVTMPDADGEVEVSIRVV